MATPIVPVDPLDPAPAPAADALSELARAWRCYEGDPDGAIRAITETACVALGVARASVWLLADDHQQLRCVDLFEQPAGTHAGGTVLTATDYPGYFAALASEEPIAAHDAHADPRTRELAAGYLTPLGIGALLDAPLRTGGELVGVICSEHAGGARAWTAAEQRDAAFLASLLSLALELAQRVRREALLTATLEATGEGIVAVDDTRVVAYNRRFLEMWGFDRPPGDAAALRAHLARRTDRLDQFIADASDAMTPSDADTIDVIELLDGRLFERIGRPQRLRGAIVGRVWSFRDVTGQRRVEAALRVREAHLRDLAIRDGLTGLFNRRHALEQLITAVTRGERLAVALLDLDEFKRINDQHGHLSGDAVLRDLARVLRDRLRTADVVGRYGGEEFLILLPHADAAQAAAVLDGIRARLSARRGTAELPRYTFSCGVAQFPDDGASVNQLLTRADQRLYQAKRAGRDRVIATATADA